MPVSRETGDKQPAHEGVPEKIFHLGHTELIEEKLVRPAGGQKAAERPGEPTTFIITHPASSA